ncbi:MAG: alpha/beta fold hydrolase [Bacillota bacterium]|nr:alpha/beta fold hydrolase [Bacillota bacterium]
MNSDFPIEEIHYQTNEFRPSVYGIKIPGTRGKLLATLYNSGGAGLHPTVLLLHGIPGNEQNGDIAQALRRNGFHVLTFHYSGCFGSDGNYALTHNLDDANTVLDYILNDKSFGFDKEHIFAVGHSMGGFVCSQITAKRKEIKGAVLMMPCDIGRIWQIGRENSFELKRIENLLEESADWLQGASKEGFLAELKEHSEEFRLESLANRLAQKPILCVEASRDIHTPPCYHCVPLENAIRAEGGTKLKSLSLETDHFASDYRLKAAKVVVDFLRDLL